MAVSGLSRRCVQNWLRWLEDRGLVDVLEPGTTPQFRPGAWAAEGRNLAREWQLTDPSVDLSCTPPSEGFNEGSPTRTRAKSEPESAASGGSASRPSPWPAQPPAWPLEQKPHRRAERLEAARTLRQVSPVLRRLSAPRLASELRPWFAAGYSPADVLYAVDYRPDGSANLNTDAVRVPVRWLTYRLGMWLGPDGSRQRPRSAVLEQVAAEVRARVDADHRDRETARAARAARPDRHAAAIRAALGWPAAPLRSPAGPLLPH